ncbi:MAG: bifunctional 2-keto-4-hydroxyglutarate aldolase/2-keto-3-deoxy-6-phosphogluconate aldolase [Bacilli bacterium]
MKAKTITRLLDCGVIAVIRADNVEDAEKLADSCIKGGIVGLEVTFTVPGANDVIKTLAGKKDHSFIVGAGTVLDEATARLAILNGAEFIVSPSFDKGVAELCNLYQIPYMAGCFTITEMITAIKAGVDVIKVFPGSLASPSYFKAVHGPLPYANLMPTGGVSIENAKEWILNGAVAIGTGGDLTSPAKNGDYDEVQRRAAAFVREVKEAREGR